MPPSYGSLDYPYPVDALEWFLVCPAWFLVYLQLEVAEVHLLFFFPSFFLSFFSFFFLFVCFFPVCPYGTDEWLNGFS